MRDVELRRLFLNDGVRLRALFLRENNLQDTGMNESHDKITSKVVRTWLKERIRMYARKKPSFVVYAVLDERKKLIGTVGVGNINYKTKSAEIGCWISEKRAGLGYGTLAVRSFLKEFLNLLHLKKVVAEVAKENIASLRILEKNRFTLKKKIKNYLFLERVF
ncbi:GNAT family N-acetyltransferase [Candidatus Woesearchaeota archaeon]|nr:GNAT family N-acetyltransferase [Candidatus Woesearchaeota archaeon]